MKAYATSVLIVLAFVIVQSVLEESANLILSTIVVAIFGSVLSVWIVEGIKTLSGRSWNPSSEYMMATYFLVFLLIMMPYNWLVQDAYLPVTAAIFCIALTVSQSIALLAFGGTSERTRDEVTPEAKNS